MADTRAFGSVREGDAAAALGIVGAFMALHRISAPGAIDRAAERRRVVEIAAHHFRAMADKVPRFGAIGVACEGAHLKSPVSQMPHRRAALLAGGSGH